MKKNKLPKNSGYCLIVKCVPLDDQYECGLKFTGCVFENMDIAQKWLEENGWCNPRAYELIPVAFYTKDGEVK